MNGAIPLLSPPNTPSWRGAYLKHRDCFAFTLPLPLVIATEILLGLWMFNKINRKTLLILIKMSFQELQL
jgi:hypothetical protein